VLNTNVASSGGSKHSFKDLVDIDHLKSIFEKFSTATGFATGLASYPEQELLIRTGWRDICVKFHRACPESEKYCKRSNKYLTEQLIAKKQLNVRSCEHGLVDGATPIIVEGRHIASLFTGQILFEKPDIKRFRKQAELYGYDTDEYLRALKDTPVVSEEQFLKALSFMSELAEVIALQGLANLRMKEVEKKTRAILDQTFQFIGLLTPDGVLVEANKTALKFAGFKESDVIGKLFWETPWWTHSQKLQDKLHRSIKKAAKGEHCRFEAFHPALDGDIHYMDVSIKPVKDTDGNVIYLIPEGHDITERIMAQNALSKSEERFRSLTENISDWIWEVDAEGICTYSSPSIKDLLGYEPNEIIGGSPFDLMDKEDVRKIESEFGKIVSAKKSFKNLVNRNLHKDGSKIVLETSGVPVFDEKGELTGYRGIDRDITDRIKVEEKLRADEKRIRRMHDAIVELVSHSDLMEGRLDSAYKVITETASKALEVGRVSLWFVDDKGDRLECVDLYEHDSKKHSSGLTKNLKDYPKYFNALKKGRSIDAVDAHNDPRTSEFSKDYLTSLNIKSVLDATIRISGKTLGVICIDAIGDAREWTSSEISFIGQVADQVVQTRSVNEHKKSEKEREHLLRVLEHRNEELHQLRNYLNNIIDSMPSVLVGVDLEGRVTQWNQQAEQETGIDAQKASGRMLTEVFPRLAFGMDKIKTAMRENNLYEDSKVAHQVNNETRYEDITVYPLIDNEVQGAVIRIDDVTERVRLEEMMIQSEKMLSVGGLAAGMAHEINNPLAGILQNIQVLQNRISPESARNRGIVEEYGAKMEAVQGFFTHQGIYPMIDSIVESGRRAAKIVNNMLTFSRKSDANYRFSDISKLLDETVELAESDYDLKKKYDFRRINIIREYDPKTPQVHCESSKIQQVFLNILKNGAHAMSGEIDDGYSPAFTLRVTMDRDMARIEIEDNGPGIEDALCKRIFEPFFTTKGVGEGSGLGLSVSYFIITENHNGIMQVKSAVNKGTNIIIHLPLDIKSVKS